MKRNRQKYLLKRKIKGTGVYVHCSYVDNKTEALRERNNLQNMGITHVIIERNGQGR